MNKNFGKVITFYSYKGGTGRTMALANIACLLARRNEKVLMIDWDLEAPGLFQYFSPYQIPGEKKGLIDLFERFSKLAKQQPELDDFHKLKEEEQEKSIAEFFENADPEEFIHHFQHPGLPPDLYFLKAGSLGEEYSRQVNQFRWDHLFAKVPWLFRRFEEWLSKDYDYVLIDSRTGLSDISQICTTLMPEVLVIVFTPNKQSFIGVEKLIRKAIKYRRESYDERPLVVFPLPSRIGEEEPELVEIWLKGNERLNIEGYQPLFEKTLKDVYDLEECNLTDYFKEVQIQHSTPYLFGEPIAVLLGNSSSRRLSLKRSYEEFTERLTTLAYPWKESSDHKQIPLPTGDALTLDSPYYYAREIDEIALNALKEPRSLVTLCGPEQMGKTSLIVRVLESLQKENREIRSVLLDFNFFTSQDFVSLNTIWLKIANEIANRLFLDDWDSSSWNKNRDHQFNIENFLKQFLFQGVDETKLLICIDSVDRVFDFPLKSDFFSSIRGFFNLGAYDQKWKKVSWLFGASLEPSVFIEEPFNVGLQFLLPPFSEQEVSQFSLRFDLKLEGKRLRQVMAYLGGNPYLIQLFFYHYLTQKTPWDKMFDVNTASKKIFQRPLSESLKKLEKEKKLATGMRQVIDGKACDDKTAIRLEAASIIRQDEQGKWIPFCKLYEKYFREKLEVN